MIASKCICYKSISGICVGSIDDCPKKINVMNTVEFSNDVEKRLDSTCTENCYYKNKLSYPGRDKYKDYLQKDLESFIGTMQEHKEYEAERKEYYNNLLKSEKEKYGEETKRLEDLFKSDLESHFNMTNHPKKDMLYSKAWDHGHASGYSEVLYWYEDLHELLT